MADFNVSHITGKQGQQGTVLAGVTTVSSTGSMRIPSGPPEHRGGRGRAVWAGGYGDPSPGQRDTMDMVEIATTGNSTDFGNLSTARYNTGGGVASSTRGLFAGGRTEASPAQNLSMIDYVIISSSGGVSDWGDLTAARQTHAGASNSTRGLYGGGRDADNSAVGINIIEFVTIATTGSISDFGDLLVRRMAVGGLNSSTRVLFCGGYSTPAKSNVIEYVEIATRGNATDFGDMLTARSYVACTSNGTRGVLTGEGTPGAGSDVIEYLAIETLGNTQDFGDLTVSRQAFDGTSNNIRGIFGGGATPSRSNVIDYVTIATTGNAADFGDLTQARSALEAVGDAHGGLGG